MPQVKPIPDGYSTLTAYLTIDGAERAIADQFYGDRMGTIEDPFGHRWHIATHVEDVSPDEMERRLATQKPPG